MGMFLNNVFVNLIVLYSAYDICTAADNCTTPNGEVGECISIHNCSVILEALTTEGKTAVEFAAQSQCGYEKAPLVCCGTIGNYTKSVSQLFKELLPSPRYCGLQHSDEYQNNRFIDTDTSLINEFPWLATLIYQHKDAETTFCVGSLISIRYVLTTAHCIFTKEASLIKVRLGEYQMEKNAVCVMDGPLEVCSEPVVDFGIEETIVHKQYDPRKHLHDVALIRLNKTVQYSDYIRPICLPPPEAARLKVGDVVVESGWGKISYEGATRITKKKILTQIESLENCKEQYNGYGIVLTDDHLCTTELDVTAIPTCLGDSGAPIMFSNRSQWYQEGIVTFGFICNSRKPDVNARVSNYVGWIVHSMRP